MVVVDEALDATALEEMLAHDLLDIIHGHAAVEGAVGVDDDDGAELAQAEAARADQLDLVLQVVLLDLDFESVLDLLATRRGATGTATD